MKREKFVFLSFYCFVPLLESSTSTQNYLRLKLEIFGFKGIIAAKLLNLDIRCSNIRISIDNWTRLIV